MIENKNFIGQIFHQNCNDYLMVKSESDKNGYYNCVFKNYPYEIVARKDKIISGKVPNPKKEIEDFCSVLYPQLKGEKIKVLQKTTEKRGSSYLWKCSFVNYPYIIYLTSTEIKRGKVLNPRIEEEEFSNKIWKQTGNEQLKILRKLSNNYWECQFLRYPYKVKAEKVSIIKGTVLNPRIEEEEFKNKIWKQKYDSLRVICKTNRKEEGQNSYLWKCQFIKYPCIIYARKSLIIDGNVDNPNYPWRTKEGILIKIKELKDKNKKVTLENLANSFGISESWIGQKIIQFQLRDYIIYEDDSSLEESKISSLIENNIKEEIKKNTYILDGKEIDIFIPSRSLGIEYNGNYWHSELFKYSNYHQEKSLIAKKKNIELIHIFEYEWKDNRKKNILKSLIFDKLSNNNMKIWARKCKIKELDTSIYNNFCEENHLQGKAGAKVKLGLYYNNELVQIMSFGAPRFTDNYQWEIIRECSKLKTCIVGGKERLWKYFIKKYNPNSVISYCDFSKFTGESYLRLGFEEKGLNKPGFVWWDQKTNQTFWRNPYKNQEFKDRNYLKIYDCGQKVFVWNKG